MKQIVSFFVAGLMVVQGVFAQKTTLGKSTWRAALTRSGNELPFGLDISPKANGKFDVYVLNGSERLLMDQAYIDSKDSLHIPMAIFDADLVMAVKDNLLVGWYKRFRNNQWVNNLPFKAVKGELYQFVKKPIATTHNVSGKYQAFFMKPNGDSTRAVALMSQTGTKLTGTFLTATGDYRYLAGDVVGDSLFLSCYDGSHVYMFRAAIVENRLVGGLWAGAMGFQVWKATKDDNASLPDPTSLAVLKPGYDRLDFSFPDSKGNVLSIKNPRYENKVVVLQIMGTWCPNCMDETRFLAPWYSKNARRGVEVIGLAFERSSDLKVSGPKLDFMQKRFQIGYPLLLAGTNDTDAGKSLPQLSRIAGYPTTIFIDKKGKVRKIHTGFSGPGTGKFYDEYIDEFNALINKLLSE
jgi:thiol-disulfide isomerase/thioredoxin